jgi:hypothetical protein
MRILYRLNRLRLWCGLFRAENYAWTEAVYCDRENIAVVASCPRGGQDVASLTAMIWILYHTVHWKHPRALEGYEDGKFDSRQEAVAYIRSCVKKGVRP